MLTTSRSLYRLTAVIGIVFFMLVCGFRSHASHVANMELSYRHVSNNVYEFTMVMYRNCTEFSSVLPPSIPLSCKSASLGITGKPAGLLLPVTGGTMVAQNISNCTTEKDSLCFEQYTFRRQIDLDVVNPSNPRASDWIFYFELCCIPTTGLLAVDNIVGGSAYSACGLNNLDFVSNNSPVWNQPSPAAGNDTIVRYPVVSICENKNVILDQHAIEYDGDQLEYEFIEPLDAGGVPAVYLSGFSLTTPFPFSTPPGFKINSVTGAIPVKAAGGVPPGLKHYVVAIKLTESRMKGSVLKEVGYVMRHLNILVDPESTCPASNPQFESDTVLLNCKDTVMEITSSDYFLTSTVDTNGSCIRVTDLSGTVTYPVKSVKVLNNSYLQTATKLWVTLNSPLVAGKYILMAQNGTDANTIVSECGSSMIPFADTVLIISSNSSPARLTGSPDSSGNSLPYVKAECQQDEIMIYFDGDVLCSSIAPDGSDFIFMDSTGPLPVPHPPIVSATPVGCVNGYTRKAIIKLFIGINTGKYGVYLKKGTDNDILINLCGEESGFSGMGIQSDEVVADLGPDLVYCKDSVFTAVLEAPAGYNYSWSTGDTSRLLIVNTKGIYILTMENPFGCQAIDTVVVTEIDCETGIDDSEVQSLLLYPNPSDGRLFIQNSGPLRTLDIVVTDIYGKEVYHIVKTFPAGDHNSIDLGELAKGICFVKLIEAGQLISTHRIVLK